VGGVAPTTIPSWLLVLVLCLLVLLGIGMALFAIGWIHVCFIIYILIIVNGFYLIWA
jgi:hypothetical protein